MSAAGMFVYGCGNMETLAPPTVKRFRRFSKDAQQSEGDPSTLAEQVLGLRPGNVVLILVFRRTRCCYAALIEAARRAGVETLVISGEAGAALVPKPDHLLSAPPPAIRTRSNRRPFT